MTYKCISQICERIALKAVKAHRTLDGSVNIRANMRVQNFDTTSSFSSKLILDRSKVPKLNEQDLEERFVSGSGPGGQKVNKAENACFLKHIPSGVAVKCHEFRSGEMNRRRARELLIMKLDDLYNGEESISAQRERINQEKSNKREQKARKLRQMKKEWKEREGID